jgi:hypothetical protein
MQASMPPSRGVAMIEVSLALAVEADCRTGRSCPKLDRAKR